jgi:hypothetical protein
MGHISHQVLLVLLEELADMLGHQRGLRMDEGKLIVMLIGGEVEEKVVALVHFIYLFILVVSIFIILGEGIWYFEERQMIFDLIDGLAIKI